jgi:DHA1 family multidrug resistance protein-like MFS transporter
MSYRRQIRSLRSNTALLALLLSNSLVLISLGMLVPIYALFVQQVGGGALSAGFTAGALAFTSALSALISGRLIDKFSRSKTRYFLIVGWAMIGVSSLAYLLVDNVGMLFAVQIFAGFVNTVSSPAFDTLYSRHLDRSSTGQEYGVWNASYFITAGIGSVLGGAIVSLYGFNGVFIMMSALAFLASAYISTIKKEILE